MGQTTSRAHVEQVVDVGIKVANRANQQCFHMIDLSNILEFKNVHNVSIHDIRQKNVGSIQNNCGTNSSSDSKTFQDIRGAVQQQAETLRNAVLPELSTVSSETYSKLVDNLQTEIVNAYSQSCGSQLYSKNVLSLVNADGVELFGVDQDAYIQTQNECVMDTVMKSDAAQQLQNTIDQAAKTESKDPLATLAEGLANPVILYAVLVVVLLVVLGPILGGTRLLTNKYFLIGLIVVILIVVMYFVFQKKKER